MCLSLFSGTGSRKEFCVFLLGRASPVDNLSPSDRARVGEWVAAGGKAPAGAEGLRFVVYTLADCCAALGCGKKQAARLRKWAVGVGLLIPVAEPSKGHAAVFTLGSLPSPGSAVARCPKCGIPVEPLGGGLLYCPGCCTAMRPQAAEGVGPLSY